MIRTLGQIRHTDRGPRPIPPMKTPAAAVAPRFVDTALANGLRVLLVHDSSAPTVHLRLMIPFANTDPGHAARATLLAHTLFAGTRRRDRRAVDIDTARVGGNVAAQVTPERLTITGTSLATGLAALLDVVVDAVLDAAYCDDVVLRAGDVLMQKVTVDRANPGTLAREALHRHRYGDHPVTRVLPDPVDIAAVVPAEIRALHRAAMAPGGAVLLLVGDVDLDQALAEAERATADWTSSATPQHLSPLPEITGGGLHVVHLPGAVQGQLRLSAQAVAHTDPRYPALYLANLAFGGGFSARLVEVIRERKGLCYAANSAMEFTQHSAGVNATVNVSMNTATETTAAALQALRAEFERFGAEPPDYAELERSRSYAIGAQLTSTMSLERLTNTLQGLVNAGLNVDWLATERELLSTVGLDDVAETARHFFAPARFTGIIMVDAVALAATPHDVLFV